MQWNIENSYDYTENYNRTNPLGKGMNLLISPCCGIVSLLLFFKNSFVSE